MLGEKCSGHSPQGKRRPKLGPEEVSRGHMGTVQASGSDADEQPASWLAKAPCAMSDVELMKSS